MSKLSRVLTIAGNTVREAVRNKVLYTLVFFAVALIGTGVLLSTLSYVEQERIIQDVGLAAIRLFGVAIAIFVGVGLIHREVDRRTIYTILSKPASRVATLWLQVAIMSVAFVAVSWLAGAPLGAGHAAAIGLIAVELALLVAIATLFSSFTTPMLASLFTSGIFVVGALSRDLRDLGLHSSSEGVRQVLLALYRVLPDLESFNLSIQAVHGLPIHPYEVWLPAVYAAGYVGMVLLLAVLIFDRRDFR
jgi:ABC-type transport system involved in multi-copper enzyme maturation permease subunit